MHIISALCQFIYEGFVMSAERKRMFSTCRSKHDCVCEPWRVSAFRKGWMFKMIIGEST